MIAGYYRCNDLQSIRKLRVTGFDHAARIFAHRLAMKLFGRGGRMLALQRVRQGPRWVQYQAKIGRLRGPQSDIPLLVTED
jgi:hypothetical protein